MELKIEQELLNSIRSLKREIVEIKKLVTPLAPQNDEFLNVSQAIALTGFSERKIRQLVADGEIPYTKKANRIRFSKISLTKWLCNI